MKQSFKNYFEITKKEWNGMVILVVLMIVILALPYAIHYFHKDEPMDLTEFNKAAARLGSSKTADELSAVADSTQDIKLPNPVMFAFNPNNLPLASWQKLGLSIRQANTIKNYEAKGGRFYTKGDLQKMYSLTAEDYKRLQPYISLPDGPAKTGKTDEVVEINTADSARLTQIKGIGPAFASRIIKYRTQLGGFIKPEQLLEIYGIDSLKYHDMLPQIKVNTAKILKININKVTIDELRRFPYLNFKQMNAIIQYRVQHGDYHSTNDLSNIVLLDDEILRKIAPYLAFK